MFLWPSIIRSSQRKFPLTCIYIWCYYALGHSRACIDLRPLPHLGQNIYFTEVNYFSQSLAFNNFPMMYHTPIFCTIEPSTSHFSGLAGPPPTAEHDPIKSFFSIIDMKYWSYINYCKQCLIPYSRPFQWYIIHPYCEKLICGQNWGLDLEFLGLGSGFSPFWARNIDFTEIMLK